MNNRSTITDDMGQGKASPSDLSWLAVLFRHGFVLLWVPLCLTTARAAPYGGPRADGQYAKRDISRVPPVKLPELTVDPRKTAVTVMPSDQFGDSTSDVPAPPARQSSTRFSQPLGGCQTAHPHGRKSRLLQQYRDQIGMRNDQQSVEPDVEGTSAIPLDFRPWWHDAVISAADESIPMHRVGVEELIIDALRYSQRVRALSELPLVRETAILEAQADFDAHAFMESKFLGASDPVGNDLTTGGPTRYRDRNWTYVAGLRQKTVQGGLFELSQRIGHQNTNSIFFNPNNQGTAQLSLSYTQPLMNGAGEAYNTSIVLLAQIDTAMAWDQLATLLQQHLLDVAKAYWRLYFQRAVFQQKVRHYSRAKTILGELEGRQEVDALRSQILLARAAVTARNAERIRARAEIRNSEATIRALVNAPSIGIGNVAQLMPTETPARGAFEIGMREALLTALENRPEIDEAVKQVWAAGVRANLSKQDLLPQLDFVMETYVSGLQGGSQIGDALVDQVGVGEPGYSVGLQLDLPIGNRAARARHQRRCIELRQLISQFKETVESLMTEVEIAVRELRTTNREMESTFWSMLAAAEEVNYLDERWQLLPGDDRSASFLLEDLLDAQKRLATEEYLFAEAQSSYTVALINQKRASGTLLQYEQIEAHRVCHQGVPQIIVKKQGTQETYSEPIYEDVKGE